jgi:hypothetical protein
MWIHCHFAAEDSIRRYFGHGGLNNCLSDFPSSAAITGRAMVGDLELLQEYAEYRSEAAF